MAEIGQFGLDVGIYGRLAQPDTVVGLARFAEQAGFGSVWLADHVALPVQSDSRYPFSASGAFPTPASDPLLEPLATLGVLAGVTGTVRLGTAVLIMPYRNPLLTARMLATIDRFSGGRVTLGAGVGWLREEFEALGADYARRGRATDEAIDVVKAVCAGGEVGFDGATTGFRPVHSSPGSVQRPHPPILIGGVSDAALRRVVRRGDGWLAVSLTADMMTGRIARLRAMAAEADRDPDGLDLVYKIFIAPGDPRPGPWGDRDIGSGSRTEIVDDLRRILDAGFRTVIVRYRGDDAAEQKRELEEFAADVIPRL